MVCLGLSLKKPRARSESDLKVDSFSGSTNFKAVFLLDMLKSPELSGLACKGTISMNSMTPKGVYLMQPQDGRVHSRSCIAYILDVFGDIKSFL